MDVISVVQYRSMSKDFILTGSATCEKCGSAVIFHRDDFWFRYKGESMTTMVAFRRECDGCGSEIRIDRMERREWYASTKNYNEE